VAVSGVCTLVELLVVVVLVLLLARVVSVLSTWMLGVRRFGIVALKC